MTEAQEAWRRTLLECEAARHYHMPYVLIIGSTFRNPLIEHLLPAILLVKAVAVFDEAIQECIDSKYGAFKRDYKQNLEGRIMLLAENGIVSNGPQLQATRRLRNTVAHERHGQASWEDLELALDQLETALQELDVVGERSKMEYFGERSGITFSEEKGVLGTRTFKIGVREDGAVAYEASWDQTLYRADPNAHGID